MVLVDSSNILTSRYNISLNNGNIMNDCRTLIKSNMNSTLSQFDFYPSLIFHNPSENLNNFTVYISWRQRRDNYDGWHSICS